MKLFRQIKNRNFVWRHVFVQSREMSNFCTFKPQFLQSSFRFITFEYWPIRVHYFILPMIMRLPNLLVSNVLKSKTQLRAVVRLININ